MIYFKKPEEWPELLKKELVQQQDKFRIRDHHIYRLQKSQEGPIIEVRFIPFSNRADYIDNFHTAFGHLSQLTVLQIMKNRVWWPMMRSDINEWLKTCPQCQLASRGEKNVHHAPMKPLDIPPAFAR